MKIFDRLFDRKPSLVAAILTVPVSIMQSLSLTHLFYISFCMLIGFQFKACRQRVNFGLHHEQCVNSPFMF